VISSLIRDIFPLIFFKIHTWYGNLGRCQALDPNRQQSLMDIASPRLDRTIWTFRRGKFGSFKNRQHEERNEWGKDPMHMHHFTPGYNSKLAVPDVAPKMFESQTLFEKHMWPIYSRSTIRRESPKCRA
jgi:hypothetical protein